MNAIILAAGTGSRMKPLTNTIPKCMIPVNGTPIIKNTLMILEECGISETSIVVGYMAQKVISDIGFSYKKMKIQYIENPVYRTTNTCFSLFLGLENSLTDDYTLILEGDVFFEKKLILALIEKKRDAISIVQKYSPIFDGSMVQINGNVIVNWVHKKDQTNGFVLNDKYKTANIHLFNTDFITNHLKPALKTFIKDSNGANEPIERVFQIMVKNQTEILAFISENYKWFEIDNSEDLVLAEKLFGN